MTDSLSDLTAGDSGSSLREIASGSGEEMRGEDSRAEDSRVEGSNAEARPEPKIPDPYNVSDGSSPTREAYTQGSHPSASGSSPLGPEISPNDLTVITQAREMEASDANISSLEGRHIGNFELKQFLGGGGMGIVFRAFDSVLSRSVAIKLLPRAGTKAETIQRFQVEARSAARLDHPNISRVFQVGSDDACDYIIFEFVEGDNLSQLVRRIGPLPYDLALRYTFQLALAIQHAYQRGVVHRDVKPANVVVTDGGKLKLIDLGLARSPKANENDNSLTATGVMLGTYDYLSPEQAKDSRSADVRSDLYSLGCTVFFMLTGQPPYPQGTPIEKIIQHSSEKRPRPSDYRADLPAGFDAMTSRLLAIDPEDRFQRPAELIAEIQELASKNNIPLLGYDDNVVVKKIITRPSWTMQLVPVLIPIVLLVGFVLYLDWIEKNKTASIPPDLNSGTYSQQSENPKSESGNDQGQENRKDSSATSDSSKGKTEASKATSSAVPGMIQSDGKGSSKANGKKETTPRVPDRSEESGLIYVGAPPEISDRVTSFEDLEAALEAVNNDPRLTEIRIYRDSVLLERPVSLKVNQSLTISSAGESECMILFRPTGSYKSSFLKVRGGNIEFRNVHFRLETNEELSSSDVVADDEVVTLFELESVSSAIFNQCSLTIDNFDDNGQKILPRARFIALVPGRKNMAMFDIQPKEATASKPSVTLKNCCIRGEADFMYLAESFPITVSLNNGLCVTDGRLFDFGPAKDLESSSQNEIEIYVTRFTAISSMGIARMDAGIQVRPLPLRIVAKQSIFNYGNQTSFLVHENLEEGVPQNKLLVLKCQDSFFPQNNPLWKLGYLDDPGTDEVFDFNAMGDWLDVTGTVGDTAQVTWQSFDGLSIPPSEHTVFDYKLSGPFEKNPAIRREAGLDTEVFEPIPPAFIE